MSYSRWSTSSWYTFWTTDSPDGWFPTRKLIRSQLLSIDCRLHVSVGEIQDNIYDLVNNVIPANFPLATQEQIKELEGYMWTFVTDMYDYEFTYKRFFLSKYYYPIRNKIKKFFLKMNFSYGIPLKREKKTEKYDFPVLTMQKEPGFKGARRFLLNKSAMELLGITHDTHETVSIGFPLNNDGKFVIGRTTDTNVPTKFKYSVHKTENSFSNGTLYEAIKKELDLDLTMDVEFIIREDNSLHVINENVNAITFKETEQKQEESILIDSNQIELNLA